MGKGKKRPPLPQNEDVGGMYAVTYFVLTAGGGVLLGIIAAIVLIFC